jgi:hypothetical protein
MILPPIVHMLIQSYPWRYCVQLLDSGKASRGSYLALKGRPYEDLNGSKIFRTLPCLYGLIEPSAATFVEPQRVRVKMASRSDMMDWTYEVMCCVN